MIDTLLQSIESNLQQSLESERQEKMRHLSMTTDMVDYDTLSRFLVLYAPTQLVTDRRKNSSSKLRLPKKLLQTCSWLKTASDLVAASKKNENVNVDLESISKALSDCRSI